MKKYIIPSLLSSLFCSFAQAHEPYVAPLSYITTNTQIPVIGGYAEEALSAEHALGKISFTITQPNNSKSEIQTSENAKTATIFDLPLKDQGTYQIAAQTSYPLKYVQHNKQWKMLFDMPADQASPIAERDYVIPSDFKKVPTPVEITREWSIQSYVSKDQTSPVQAITTSPIQVEFKTHPNNIKAQQAVQVLVKKSGQVLKNAELLIRSQSQTDKQAQKVTVNPDGLATLSFPHAGQYLVEVSEAVDATAKPVNQYYTIISLGVLPVTAQ
ncbi:MAG: DUF4198 domain-containing protein [Acinetobacter sp.]